MNDSTSNTDEQILKSIEDNSQVIEQKAKEIASKEVESLKSGLLEALGGKDQGNDWGWEGRDSAGRPAPKDWNEAPQKILSKAEEIAERKIEEKLKAREEDSKKQQEEKEKRESESKQEQIKSLYEQMSKEWREAVADEVLPDISEDIKKELQSGKKFEELTEEQRNDPGLKAWNEVRELHVAKMKAGESSSLYRTAQKFYKKKPAGASAPVTGAAPSQVSSNDDEVESLDETRKRRRSWFGF